ncbi:PREDICTED: fasciclin-like arabinogalactan protein 13 [Fragaria vesca subsp. vesca]|uniref:fasciclin-like arabinogalactan protein 13 n=1 Tax=Fragaria vesca subsp. vesca TaxID=101020 RepID=UPI0002C2FB41|nr:PREDICTED: fasciclin-like arabinogalactan protein 13 [Fragaria vesca subsp. vesca]
MAASTHSLPLLLLLLAVVVFHAEAQTAPAPAPSGPLNFTGILDKAGQYTTFLRLLSQTQVATQIQSQLNSTTEGLTVFAPTDNAFTNLKAGTLNDLSSEQQVQLVLYHVLPKYYTLASLLTVSNPVRTQSSSQNGGGSYGLNFTGSGGNQVNVSSGAVTTQINNALRQQFPLAVYQIDKVLLPNDMFAEASPAPTAAKTPAGSTNTTKGTVAAEPSTDGTSGSSKTTVGSFVGLALGLALFFMGSS